MWVCGSNVSLENRTIGNGIDPSPEFDLYIATGVKLGN